MCFSVKGGGFPRPMGVFKTQCFQNTACLVCFSVERGGGSFRRPDGRSENTVFSKHSLLSVFLCGKGEGGGSKGLMGVFKTQCFQNTACLVCFSVEKGGLWFKQSVLKHSLVISWAPVGKTQARQRKSEMRNRFKTHPCNQLACM